MTIEYHSQPERFLGTGTVFIYWDETEFCYFGYWDSFPDGNQPLEEAPRCTSLDEAVRWGRERTPRVLIRPESDPGEYYWAGLGEPLAGDAELKRVTV
jgi:hypothetical protein